MRINHFLLCVSLIFCKAAQCQSEDNPLAQKAAAAFSLAFDHADSALYIGKIIAEEALQKENPEAVAGAYNTIGWAYRHKGHLDSALHYFYRSREQFSALYSDRDVVRVSINLGEVYTQKAQYNAALKHLLTGDSLTAIIKDTALDTDLKRQLGIVYRELKDYQNATLYFRQALSGFRKLKDDFRYINTATSLGILYRTMEQPDSSLAILYEAMKLAEKNNSPDYQQAMIHENIGETFYQNSRFSEALPWFQKAYQTFKRLNNQADLAYEALSVGKTLLALHRYPEAATYLLQSYHISKELNNIKYQSDAVYALNKLYERTGDWKQAHAFLQTYNVLKDSLDLASQLISTNELKEKYQSEKKEQEITLLKTQQALIQSQARRASLLQYLFILLFAVAAAAAWGLAYRIRVRKKLAAIENQQRVMEELEDERLLNQFAVSLYGRNTIDDVLWDIANNCIHLLHWGDCVVYRADAERQILTQAAAAGPKQLEDKRIIFNPIEIAYGKGIVGSVAVSNKAEIVGDTGMDPRYIIDDAVRASEITVPIMVDGQLFGIIDSEDPRTHFYTKRHLLLLQNIAAVCSQRLVRLLAEDRLRNAIARDLHDEMGSTLTSIHILSNLAIKQYPEQTTTYLEKIKNYAGTIMESMSDIIWAINPQHDTLDRLLLRMKSFSVELLEPAGIRCVFSISGLRDNPDLLPEERKFVYLIFKESLNNIIKYSKATEVTIDLSKDHTSLIMSITDNGVGFDKEQQSTGNGLHNMVSRAKAIGGILQIETAIGKGTCIRLEKRLTR